MRITLWCSNCNHPNVLGREVKQPETLRLICVNCEARLQVTITDEHIARAAYRRVRSGRYR